jgi:F-type H+-transporting ATPase subunit delta
LIGSKVAKRYAKALFSIGQEDRKVDEYARDLIAFTELYLQHHEFAGAISSRIFAQEDRKRVLKAVLDKSGFAGPVRNFISLLLDRERIGEVEGITKYYERLMDEASNIARAEVFVPRPLKTDALNRLEKSLGKMISKQVKLEVREDPSLIGGIMVKVGDLVLDGSMKAQLRGLRESL